MPSVVYLGDKSVFPIMGVDIACRITRASEQCQENIEALDILRGENGMSTVKDNLRKQIREQKLINERLERELFYTEGDVERIIDYYRGLLATHIEKEVPLEAKDENVL